ncbi:MAG: hypothetical protein SAJ12_02585 [Jaaginema sp. PMC 1079.18]|nr:hypothetical protein [Jaaginema sp. PMC 1080.18]MEC4849876.1 hypothetical protein [Jaaginema sp. PMC 1079.18]MEC4866865.1 hypothetical protein [Jaaginema sp. PMC 1078.18]
MDNQPLGCLDFLDFIDRGHPEFSLLAVRAPFEATIEAWIEFCRQQKTKQRDNPDLFARPPVEVSQYYVSYPVIDVKVERYPNLTSRPSQKYEYVAPGNLVVKAKDNDWTIIVRLLFNLTGEELRDVPQETQALSQLLQTQTLDFMEEDTSCAIGYTCYDNGEVIEGFEAGDWLSFESKIRPVPDNFEEFSEAEDYGLSPDMPNQYDTPDRFDRKQFINDFFTEQGIYIPACYPAWNNSSLIFVESEDNESDPADPRQSVYHQRYTEDGDCIKFRFPEMSDATLALAVEPQSENTIERADLVVIETTLADKPSAV